MFRISLLYTLTLFHVYICTRIYTQALKGASRRIVIKLSRESKALISRDAVIYYGYQCSSENCECGSHSPEVTNEFSAALQRRRSVL